MNDVYVRNPTPAMNKNKGSDDNYLVAKKRIRVTNDKATSDGHN